MKSKNKNPKMSNAHIEEPTFNGKNEHKASEIVIKKALVDIKIQPIVIWLNSFHSVETMFCCEGDPNPVKNKKTDEKTDDAKIQKPYVSFVCSSMSNLFSIYITIEKFKSYPHFVWNEDKIDIITDLSCHGPHTIVVESFESDDKFLRFYMEFSTQHCMLRFVNFLKSTKRIS